MSYFYLPLCEQNLKALSLPVWLIFSFSMLFSIVTKHICWLRSTGGRYCDEYWLLFKTCSCNIYVNMYTACISAQVVLFLVPLLKNRKQMHFQGHCCRQHADVWMVESVKREQRALCSDLWVMKSTLKVLKRTPTRQQFNWPSQKKPAVFKEHLHCRNEKFSVGELFECLCPDKLDLLDPLNVCLKTPISSCTVLDWDD